MTRTSLALIGAGLIFCGPALAHDHADSSGSWIGQQRMTDPRSGEFCCDQRDCFAELVSEFSDFIVVMTGEMIPTARVIWRSADGQWWRCRVWMNGEQKTRCLIGPPKGL